MSIRQALRKLTGRVSGRQSEIVLGEDANGNRKVTVNIPSDKPYVSFTNADYLSVLIDELCTAYWYLKGEDVSEWVITPNELRNL